MQQMQLFQSEMFIMRIPGRSNISRKTFLKNYQIVLQIKKMKKNCHYSVWLIILEYSRNLRRKIRKIWIELHIYFYMK